MNTLAPPARAVPLARDLRTISVVSVAHGTSHFFHLLLPPLFPTFIREFGLSYSELGLLLSVFFVVSGIGQALAGFLVDRVGARPVLQAALACFVAAALAVASARGYAGLVAAAALAGLGNSPFHPVDFTILNKRVSAARLGHAYSVHGVCGTLGWAVAPIFLVGVAEVAGQWRAAYVAAALLALGVLLLVLLQRQALDDGHALTRATLVSARTAPGIASRPTEHPLAFLKLPVLWACFAYFAFSTCAVVAIQGFAGPALGRMYGLALSATAGVVTGYMVFSAIGMALGGFIAGRVLALERTIVLAGLLSALLLVAVGVGMLPAAAALAVVAVAGFGNGAAGPSRDMLIKRATPPGATGRVYGAVYSGADVGFAAGAPLFGWLLDHGAPGDVFHTAAAALVLAVLAAAGVALLMRRAGRRGA